jgi:hypothetical protein
VIYRGPSTTVMSDAANVWVGAGLAVEQSAGPGGSNCSRANVSGNGGAVDAGPPSVTTTTPAKGRGGGPNGGSQVPSTPMTARFPVTERQVTVPR